MKKILFSILLLSLSSSANICSTEILDLLMKVDSFDPVETIRTVKMLDKFAVENNLPVRTLELGPESRRVKRMFVAVDMNDKELVNKYLATFNMENETDKVMALEFGFEVPNEYVTGVLRPYAAADAPIYRWGRKDLKRDHWEKEWLVLGGGRYQERLNNPIWGYSHLIGVNKDEVININYFLENPTERAACKSSNCVAWLTGIELGRTKKDVELAERRPLFNELGVSRSSAHFEIGRRLFHAANEKHSAVVVFVNGDKGKAAFNDNLLKYLPPEPQMPYASIIKSLGLDPNGDLISAFKKIPDGSRIYFPIAAGASPEGMGALVQVAKDVEKGFDVTILINGISENEIRKGAELADGKLRFNAHFMGGSMRKLHQEGKISYVPGYLSDFPRFIEDPTMPDFKYDAIILRVSPPDEFGNHSLGPNYDTIFSVIKSRPDIKIIAEINENIPFTTGKNIIHKDQIFTSFVSKSKLAGPPVLPLTPVEALIGKYLGELVDNNAHLQVGIGNIFGGLPKGLIENGKTGIKISTEMFGDPLKEMLENGTADSAETGFAYGSEGLYKWLNRNEKVRFVDTLYVNSPGRVADTPGFHAINTALEVKLTGEVNAEMGPDGRLSSPGGQVEFMSGAARSIGGKSIIAIRSTAKDKQFSTIRTSLYSGHVTTPAESVHYVVTEYGIARLKGKTTWQRAIELINVSHPKFRAELKVDAIESGIINMEQSILIKMDVPEIAYEYTSSQRYIASSFDFISEVKTFFINLFNFNLEF